MLYSLNLQEITLTFHVECTDYDVDHHTDNCEYYEQVVQYVRFPVLFHFVDIENNGQNDNHNCLEDLHERNNK